MNDCLRTCTKTPESCISLGAPLLLVATDQGTAPQHTAANLSVVDALEGGDCTRKNFPGTLHSPSFRHASSQAASKNDENKK